MEKAINKLINGYHVALDAFVDEIYYINSIVFCAPSATIIEGDSDTLCTITTTTTLAPSCAFNGGTVIKLEDTTTTTTTTLAPNCAYSGGTVTLLT